MFCFFFFFFSFKKGSMSVTKSKEDTGRIPPIVSTECWCSNDRRGQTSMCGSSQRLGTTCCPMKKHSVKVDPSSPRTDDHHVSKFFIQVTPTVV
uniref:Putative secreted protein ovary overexpressed n=1 Tax=Rhipicephalus microplus TaxID=6941 RepID=A0A6M2DA50_RHIMP